MTSDDTKPTVLSAARAKLADTTRAHDFRAVAEALLAHLDAIAAGEVPDGEALPALEPQHTPTADRFDGEVWRGRVKVDDDWAHVAVRTIDGVTAPMFYWHGKWRGVAESFGYEVMAAWALAQRAAGRSEGEAELARMTEKEAIAREMMEKCAEGERRTREAWVDSNERATQEGIDIGREQGWKEANVEIDRLVAARAGERASAAEAIEGQAAEIARLTAELAAAHDRALAHGVAVVASTERAMQAQIDALAAELAEARASGERWKAACERQEQANASADREDDKRIAAARLDGAREEREACVAAVLAIEGGSDAWDDALRAAVDAITDRATEGRQG